MKKIDEATGKVTLDHEAIPNIDMDAMAMAYKVQDPAMLNDLSLAELAKKAAQKGAAQFDRPGVFAATRQ